jgi:hypothetical protein
MRFATLVRLVCLGVAALGIIAVAWFESPDTNDFRSFYRGASELRAHRLGDLYSEERLSKQPLVLPFIRPPVDALFLMPFTLLPFRAAWCVWLGLQSALFLGFLWAAQGRVPKAGWACLFPPALVGIGHGQDCALFLAIPVFGYLLLRRGKELTGGAVLGLGLLKFHLFLLWPLALVLRKQWRALGGFCAAGLALAVASVAAAGPSGMKEYFALLMDPRLADATPGVAREVGVGGLLANFSVTSWQVQAAIGLAIAGIALYAARRGGPERLFIILPAASLAVPPHALYYDPTMLLVSLWLVHRTLSNAWLRSVALVLATPLVFLGPTFSKPWSAVSSLGLLAFLFIAIGTRRSLVSGDGFGVEDMERQVALGVER